MVDLLETRLARGGYSFKCRTQDGLLIAGNTSDKIQRFLYSFGVWEPSITEWLTRRIKPGDLCVDVGANIGYYSLLMSQLAGAEGRVIALEPCPELFHQLKANLSLNRVSNVCALQVAAWQSEEMLPLYRGPDRNLGKTSLVPCADQTTSWAVSARPLDRIIAREDWPRVRLIKIDVEGAELAVVRGLRRLLRNSGADLELVVEVSKSRIEALGGSVRELYEVMRQEGFVRYSIDNNYSALSYLNQSHHTPMLSRDFPEEQYDAIFSRAPQ